MPLEKQLSFEDSAIWKLKLKLQFSGWLLYIIHAIWVLLMLIIAGLGWLLGYWPLVLFWLPLGIAILLSIALVGTILMVKYRLHPQEHIPDRKDDLDVFALMKTRHSCRSFQSRQLTPAHNNELMQAAKHYSQQNQQLGDVSIRFEYVAAALTVWPVVGAHEFLVAIAPREYNRLSIIDVGRSLQKVVLHATKMGLATCWIGPGADQESIIQHLGERYNQEKDHVICVCAIGYESMFKPLFIRLMRGLQHNRLPLSDLFFADAACHQSLDAHLSPFNAYYPCYEVCQWSPSSYNGQTTRCVGVTETIDNQVTLQRFDFYAATKSRYYAAVALGIWCANWETGCESLNKKGHFEVLSSNQYGVAAPTALPHYDISWVID